MTTTHGGLDAGELRSLGLKPGQVLDFSANINPLGTSLHVRNAAAESDLSAYPDRHSIVLREKLAAQLEVGTENLVVGNGSTELIHLLARACLRLQDKCLIFAPTFGEYEAAANVAGADVHLFWAGEAQEFRWSIDEAIEAIERVRPSMTFVCNPNNPTGVYLDHRDIERIRRSVDGGSLLVLDEAYVPLADRRWNSLPLLSKGNVALLRSMTKDHALAGARLGYLVAQPDVVSVVQQLQPAWSVNAVAQAAGVAALEDDAHVEAARKMILEAKEYLYRELEVSGHSGHAFVCQLRDGSGQVMHPWCAARSCAIGIAVRDCTSFGLPEHIRVAVRRPEECARFIESLRVVLGLWVAADQPRSSWSKGPHPMSASPFLSLPSAASLPRMGSKSPPSKPRTCL